MKKLKKSPQTRVNTWESLRKKMKNFGYASMIALTLGATGCSSNETEIKKSADTYEKAVKNTKKIEKAIKNKKEEIQKDKQELQKDENDLKMLEQQLINAKKVEQEKLQETEKEIQKAKSK